MNIKLILIACLMATIEPLLAQKITFMPQWHAQSQFAGYYVAFEKGYYKDEGLDVTIKHMSRNSTRPLSEELMSNNADIVSMSLIQAIQARAEGNKFVNVLQLSQNDPNYCITTKPIKSIEDLNGCRVGRWKIGNVQIFDLVFKKYNVNVDWIVCGEGVNLYLFDAVDAILVCSYNEYYRLLSSIGKIDDNCVIKANELGYNYPTDGLYVREEFYNENKETIEKFIRATIKGWIFADNNEEETLRYVEKWRQLTHYSSNKYRNKMMLRGVLEMFKDHKSGKMDFAPVEKGIFEEMNDELYNNKNITQKVEYNEFIKTDLIHENNN